MKDKRSALRAIIDTIYTSKTLEEALGVVEHHLNDADLRIDEYSKNLMLVKSRACVSLVALQKYMTNSWFKFEGMSTR
jgi:hypothetical protein